MVGLQRTEEGAELRVAQLQARADESARDLGEGQDAAGSAAGGSHLAGLRESRPASRGLTLDRVTQLVLAVQEVANALPELVELLGVLGDVVGSGAGRL